MHYYKEEAIIRDINKILSSHNLPAIKYGDITITNLTATDGVKAEEILSRNITDHIWPSIFSTTAYHYTSASSAENILNNNNFRLYNLEKNFHADEIVAFCKDHSLLGYLQTDSNGDPYYKTDIMSQIYSASFADIGASIKDQILMWNTFAPGNSGVRLKLNLTSNRGDLRKIAYSKNSKQKLQVLKELTEKILKDHKINFTLSGISRLCAFYLPQKYGYESEIRMLHKHVPNSGINLTPKIHGQYNCIEIPLGQESMGYRIDVIEICTNFKLGVPPGYKIIPKP